MELEKSVIGIELGSTRIKAVLLDDRHTPVASGSYEWENHFVDGVWTYAMDEVREGLRICYDGLKKDVREKLGLELTVVGAIGVSAMMHGYLPFDRSGRQLVQFRTWRNTITGEAAEKLSALFGFNIPQRWSIAHLYQAILNGEKHTEDIAFLTTLSGYVHWQLTGEKVIGIGDASGMFPIDSTELSFNRRMLEQFDRLVCDLRFPWKLRDILPKVLTAGACGGRLTEEGALFLDPTGTLKPGVPVAPCEGDAGTGMTATNSVRIRTGNVSAGTSDFAMLVSDHELKVHREVDMVTTPAGLPVAMVHCNNCTSDINAWVNLFSQFADGIGKPHDKGELFTFLFNKALEGDADCGGLLSYNYLSGEGVTDLNDGRPVFARFPNCNFSLANFMRVHLLSALATLKIGLDILTKEENVRVDKLYGHGGFFKTPEVGQRLLSAAVGAPVSVMATAGEGGPYGMALLCSYMLRKDENETLEDYLDNKVYKNAQASTLMADASEIEGFNVFLKGYRKAFEVERTAVETM
ncbi:MAG: FGGY-family carbohydrate kinase [Oscillospiraceae bacterium]|nr:FGGY-family carbohydrate kinase [Oscillospiraceae bacterium]